VHEEYGPGVAIYGEKRITVDSTAPVVENGEATILKLLIKPFIRNSSKGYYGKSYTRYIFVADLHEKISPIQNKKWTFK